MCTYVTEVISAEGSGKGADGWFRLTQASVYFDHPYYAPFEHSLNVDFLNPSIGPSARTSVELSAESARELALAILNVLDVVPEGLVPDQTS